MISKTTQEKLRELVSSNEFSGVITVKKGDTYLFKICGGFQDIPNQILNNFETKFGIASGTKFFTSLGILKLQEEGKLHITDSILKYTNDQFPKYTEDITLKHLLTHTSGIPDYLDEENPTDLSHVMWHKMLKPKDYLSLFPQTEIEFPPGTMFKYNNGAYILLAHIIDTITGDYHKFIEDMIEEIGLHDTKFYKMNQLPNNTAIGYIFDDNTYRTNIYEMPIIGGGDGGIYSTEGDIHKLWQEVFSYNVISKGLLDELRTPFIPTRRAFYGLGVWLTDRGDHYNVEIIGQDQGVSFISMYNPLDKISTTIISNNDSDAWKALNIIENKES